MTTPRDSGLGSGRPPDMPTIGTTGGAGQARAEGHLPPGSAGWLLTPDDLDQLSTYATETSKEQQMREPIDARTLGRLQDLPAEDPRQPDHSPATDRHRPVGGSWPEDGITLTYGELRRLLALHLTQLAHTMPRHEPWLYAEAAAQAMQDGETPLRLREVLE